jgi:hypothetical protein
MSFASLFPSFLSNRLARSYEPSEPEEHMCTAERLAWIHGYRTQIAHWIGDI